MPSLPASLSSTQASSQVNPRGGQERQAARGSRHLMLGQETRGLPDLSSRGRRNSVPDGGRGIGVSSKGFTLDDGVSVWRGLRTASERTGALGRKTLGLLDYWRGGGGGVPQPGNFGGGGIARQRQAARRTSGAGHDGPGAQQARPAASRCHADGPPPGRLVLSLGVTRPATLGRGRSTSTRYRRTGLDALEGKGGDFPPWKVSHCCRSAATLGWMNWTGGSYI